MVSGYFSTPRTFFLGHFPILRIFLLGHLPRGSVIPYYIGCNNCHEFNFYLSNTLLPSIQLLFKQSSFYLSSFYLDKNVFISPASILAVFFLSIQLLLRQVKVFVSPASICGVYKKNWKGHRYIHAYGCLVAYIRPIDSPYMQLCVHMGWKCPRCNVLDPETIY